MRCYCCNAILTEQETRLKGALSKQFLDMCYKCIDASNISVLGGKPKWEQEEEYPIYEDLYPVYNEPILRDDYDEL